MEQLIGSSGIPNEIIIGDSILWKWRNVEAVNEIDDGIRDTIDIKASEGWTLKFTAVGKLGIIAITATADDEIADDFKFTAAAATTAAYTAGDYKWSVTATKATERYTLAEGWITCLDNIGGRSALYDNRSHAKKVLDAIEAVIENRATQTQQSYQIAGRAIAYIPIPELIKLRALYKDEVEGEQIVQDINMGLGSSRTIKTQFR